MEDNPCCQSMIQTFLIIFNCVAFVISGAVLGFSIYCLADGGFNKSMLPEEVPDVMADVLFNNEGKTFQLPVIILCSVSAFILIISFLGCLGSCQQSRCLVSLYFMFLTSFLVVLVGGTAYCFLGDPQKPIASSMMTSMAEYKEENMARELWDTLQTKLHCCGVESIDDWLEVDWNLNGACKAPASCLIYNVTQAGDLDKDKGKKGNEPGNEENETGIEDNKPGKKENKPGYEEKDTGNVTDPVDLENVNMENDTGYSLMNSTESSALRQDLETDCLSNMSVPHYNEGCLPRLKDSMHKYINIIGAIMVGVWVIVIINVLFSFALCVVLDYAEYTYK